MRNAVLSLVLFCFPAVAQFQPVESYALNNYVRTLDGQWEGIRYASDGNVYFASSTHDAHHGAAFFKYDPKTTQITMLTDDITKICGEDPQTNPQGKIHSDIVEANGWLYFSTYFGNDATPGAYSTYTGSHVLGYQLSTGIFRDYGVVLANHSSYSGVGVDPARNYVYVFITGESATQASYLFRINTVTGAKTNLGQVGGTYYSCFWLFVDRRGDVWFSASYENGDLQRVHGDTGQIQVYPNALPPLYLWDRPQVDPDASHQSQRFMMWIQPLDPDRALFTLGYYGGMLYMFDSTKAIGSGQEFTNVQHIGYSDLGLAIGNNRVFYYQRANRGYGRQADEAPGGIRDFHLLSVSLNATDHFAISDHGLLQDQSGRLLWRAPGMMTDGNSHVFLAGDWWTIPGDLGSLHYTVNPTTGSGSYVQLDRGEFFAAASVDLSRQGTVNVTPSQISLSPSQTQQFTATVQNSPASSLSWTLDNPLLGSISATGLYQAPAVVSSRQTVTVTAATSTAQLGSATITLQPVQSGTATAQFLNVDAATQGNWKAAYGGDGFNVVGDVASYPVYSVVAQSGQSYYAWAASTADPRALRKAGSATDRIAAAWYATTSFTVDVNLTDGQVHKVALYLLDYDSGGRSQTITILDAGSSAQLDVRTGQNFAGGEYLVWNLSGHVLIRVVKNTGSNAVLSGLFFGGAVTVAPPPPTVSITSPTQNQTVSGTVAVTAVASSSAGIASVQFLLDGANLGSPVTSAPYTVNWVTSAASNTSHALTAAAVDSLGQHTTSAPVQALVSNSGPPQPAAVYVTTDTGTMGSWSGKYGQDGQMITNLSPNVPSYAVTQITGANSYTWVASTSDPRALLKSASGPDRIASAWYASAFTIDMNFTDGLTHQLALYSLDWDSNARSQTISIVNASTQAVLDSRAASNFGNGQYIVWKVTGHVLIQVTRVSGPNAVINGIFFGGAGATTPPPTVSITAPAANQQVSGATALTASAASQAAIASVQFKVDGNSLGTVTASPYEVNWDTTTAGNGAHTLTAIATDTLNQQTTSSTVTVTVANGTTSTSAQFLPSADTTTKGNWKGVYGNGGYLIANDSTRPPSFATASFTGTSLYNWADSTSDSRALLKGNSVSDRIASTWFASSFTIDVSFTDNQTHRLSLYCVDWDSANRAQTVQIQDAATQTVLDNQSLASFVGGAYLSWDIRGHVLLRITRTAGPNAVVSGLFF